MTIDKVLVRGGTLVASLALVLFGARSTSGQTPEETTGELSAAAANEFALPDIPALSFLGATPQSISRPGTLQDVAADIVSGIGDDGRVKQGLAVEVSVAQLRTTAISLKEYQSSRSKFMWDNLRFSFGSVRVAGDSSATDFAVAIRIPIINNADPMRDKQYAKQLGQVLLAALPSGPESQPDTAAARAGIQALNTNWRSTHWNASRLEFAIANGWRLPDSKFGGGQFLGVSVWGSGGLQIRSWGQLLVFLRHDYRNDVPGVLQSNNVIYGGRLIGGSPQINLFGELVGTSSFFSGDTKPEDKSSHTSGSWSIGAEYRLSDGMWLSTGVGSQFETLLEEANEVALIAGLRWGVSSGARIRPGE